jgi:hypothetical protein
VERHRNHRARLHAPPREPAAAARTARSRAGEPLPNNVRAAFEPRFGHDFGKVRVHHDAQANDLAGETEARAFAVGNHLYFRQGAYDPVSLEGAHLLAHELTHVVQASRGAQDESRDDMRLSHESDPQEAEARDAASAAVLGSPVAVAAPAPAGIAREAEKTEGGDSIFSTIGDFLKMPTDIADFKIPGFEAGASVLGAMGGFDKMMSADSTTGAISGLLGMGSGVTGLAKWFGEDTLGEMGGKLGGVSGLLGAGSSALDAYDDFSKGEYGKGALDTTKAVGGTLSGLGSLGGFELASVAEMGAGEALLGGGAEGLAALGPAGAVLGAGLAGAAAGTWLSENTTVGEHTTDTMGGLDEWLSDGDGSWALKTSEAMSDNWDEGNYLSAIGEGAELAGFATLGALGGLGGGIVDGVEAIGGGISDAASWVGDNLNPLDWF